MTPNTDGYRAGAVPNFYVRICLCVQSSTLKAIFEPKGDFVVWGAWQGVRKASFGGRKASFGGLVRTRPGLKGAFLVCILISAFGASTSVRPDSVRVCVLCDFGPPPASGKRPGERVFLGVAARGWGRASGGGFRHLLELIYLLFQGFGRFGRLLGCRDGCPVA